jgi:hypothetical protein
VGGKEVALRLTGFPAGRQRDHFVGGFDTGQICADVKSCCEYASQQKKFSIRRRGECGARDQSLGGVYGKVVARLRSLSAANCRKLLLTQISAVSCTRTRIDQTAVTR